MQSQIIHLLQKGICFRKLTNITFAYLLSPHQTNLYTRLHNSASNWVQIIHISQEIFSRKIDYYFCVPIVFINISKKISESKSSDKVAQFWPKLGLALSIKREFIGKVDQHCIGLLYPIMLHNFQKSPGRADHKVPQFLPKFPLAVKGNFLGKLINITNA